MNPCAVTILACDGDERREDAVGDVDHLDLAPVEDVAEGEADEAAAEAAVHGGDGGLGCEVPLVLGDAQRAAKKKKRILFLRRTFIRCNSLFHNCLNIN